jgi:YD repeat-containing protein
VECCSKPASPWLAIIGASAALSALGCSEPEPARSAALLVEAEIEVERNGSTTIRRAEVIYEGSSGRIKEIVLSRNGEAAGRMEATYDGLSLAYLDLFGTGGERTELAFGYDRTARLRSLHVTAPSVHTASELEYDDVREGRPREVTTRVTPAGGAVHTSFRRFDHDERGRLQRVTDIAGETTGVREVRFDAADRVERTTLYAGSRVVETYTYAYDGAGRLEGVSAQSNERWDVRYTPEGLVGEIRRISPALGETTTIRYGYGSGSVAGIRFAPDLPDADLFDLRGEPFATIDFLSFPPASLGAGGLHPGDGDSGGGGGGGGGGGSPSCAGQSAATACQSCAFSNCCAQYETCVNSRDCVDYYGCIGTCSDWACWDQCGSWYPLGEYYYDQLIRCVEGACATVCY